MCDLNEAYSLYGEPEPAAEDHVDIFCPHCLAAYSTKVKGIHRAMDEHITIYKNYIGNEHCEMVVDPKRSSGYGEKFFCPRGCTHDRFSDAPTEMLFFDESGNASPYNKWEAAQKAVVIARMRDNLEELESEYKDYGHNEVFNIL